LTKITIYQIHAQHCDLNDSIGVRKITPILENKYKTCCQGDRYTFRIQGRDTYLFFEGNASIGGNNIGRWFLERRNSN